MTWRDGEERKRNKDCVSLVNKETKQNSEPKDPEQVTVGIGTFITNHPSFFG